MYVTPLSSDASERRNSSVPKGSSEVFFEASFNVRGAAYWWGRILHFIASKQLSLEVFPVPFSTLPHMTMSLRYS